MKMQERTYKKFQNEVKKFLSTAEREAAEKYLNLWGTRLAGVKQTRNDIYLKVRLHIIHGGGAVHRRAVAVSEPYDMLLCTNCPLVLYHPPQTSTWWWWTWRRLGCWLVTACMRGMQGTLFKDTKAALNRSVLKVHERLARDLTKVVGDDRELRMQALKANDFARYQEMLKATAGMEAAQDERCASIHVFAPAQIPLFAFSFPSRATVCLNIARVAQSRDLS